MTGHPVDAAAAAAAGDSKQGAGEPPRLAALFAAFFKIGVLGFGGVAAFARHVLVVERRFLTPRGFAELFGVASTLPGANTVNLAVMLGDRSRGPLGALVAATGLLGAPLLILIAVASLYARFGSIGLVQAAVSGAAAAAAGLVLGTSLKLLRDLGLEVVTWSTAAAICVASALLKLPMLLILAVAIPASLALGAVRERRR